MNRIYHSIAELVGETPLLELGRYEKKQKSKARILAKLESFNPSGSIKDRAALNMILKAEEEGRIQPGDTIVEQTSGNTGIGLAAFAALRGYKMEIFLERGASVERRLMLEAYGAKLLNYRDALGIRTEEEIEAGWKDLDREATMAEIYAYCERKGRDHYYINQVTNTHNPEAHIQSTGPEIWEATEGKVDILVCMAGTGGTMTGLARYFKEKNPNFKLVLAQPHPDDRITPEHPDVQIIDGVLPVLRVPKEELSDFLTPDLCCECFDVHTEEAFQVAREVARTEGLLIGTSSAAALFAAARVGERKENIGKNIIVIMPDDGMKYLSTPMFRAGQH